MTMWSASKKSDCHVYFLQCSRKKSKNCTSRGNLRRLQLVFGLRNWQHAASAAIANNFGTFFAFELFFAEQLKDSKVNVCSLLSD